MLVINDTNSCDFHLLHIMHCTLTSHLHSAPHGQPAVHCTPGAWAAGIQGAWAAGIIIINITTITTIFKLVTVQAFYLLQSLPESMRSPGAPSQHPLQTLTSTTGLLGCFDEENQSFQYSLSAYNSLQQWRDGVCLSLVSSHSELISHTTVVGTCRNW